MPRFINLPLIRYYPSLQNKIILWRILWGVNIAAYSWLAIWFFKQPFSISSDDALFFIGGVKSFSILEFRPHFPGYPGFILLAKLLTIFGLSPENSIRYISILSALAIPPLSGLLIFYKVKQQFAAILTFAAMLTMPLLPLLGLLMLSDGCGIMMLLIALILQENKKPLLAGIAFGLTLSIRPSFLLIVIIPQVFLMIKNARTLNFKISMPLISGFVICGMVFLVGLFAIEGYGLLNEALRFTSGHFSLWGNNILSDNDDKKNLFDMAYQAPLLATIMITLLITSTVIAIKNIKLKQYNDILIITLTACIWVFLFQNPENMRHLSLPLILLILLITSAMQSKYYMIILIGVISIQSLIFIAHLTNPPALSPLAQIAKNLIHNDEEYMIITNHGVAYLKYKLPMHRISDAYYKNRVKYLLKNKNSFKIYIISSNKIKEYFNETIFNGRVLGEKNLILYIQQAKYRHDNF